MIFFLNLIERILIKSKEESHTPGGMALLAPVIKILDVMLVRNITLKSEARWQQTVGSVLCHVR
jgi:hypothetical protein